MISCIELDGAWNETSSLSFSRSIFIRLGPFLLLLIHMNSMQMVELGILLGASGEN